MRLIAITGGIGSGKSVVSRMVEVMGFHVYDCDSRAKALMVQDKEVKQQLVEAFGQETYFADGSINRIYLSNVAFADDASRARLNGIVHPATALDIKRWAEEQRNNGAHVAFVETALLRTGGLDRLVDEVWHVTAPVEVRIQRVIARNGLTASQVKSRMASQAAEENVADGEKVLINDGDTPLLSQVMQLLNQAN